MTNIEKVEKLREKANINYADAKDALERSNWDILDAMILLESEGKVPTQRSIVEVSYTTKEDEQESKRDHSAAGDRTSFGDVVRRFFRWLGKIIRLGNANDLIVEKNGEVIIKMSSTVFVILLVLGFYIIIPLMIVGLFFRFRYSFDGPNLGKETINNVMHKATDVAEDIKGEFKSASKTEDKSENE